MTRLLVIHLVTIGVALTVLPAPVLAQQRQGPSREQMEQRIRTRFGEQVRRELGLSAEQLEAVQQVEASFQEQRSALVRRETEMRRRLRARAQPAEDESRAILQEMAAVRQDEARLFQAEMQALLGMLSAEQVLRFYELRNQLMERVLRLRRPSMDRRPGRPPRGPFQGVALTAPPVRR